MRDQEDAGHDIILEGGGSLLIQILFYDDGGKDAVRW